MRVAVATGTARLEPSPPYPLHPDRNRDRGPLGRFRPLDLRDEMGRRLLSLDLREVERRLKARRPRGDDG